MEQIFSQKIAAKGLDFIVSIDKDVPKSIIIDEVRLRQIMLNIIGNAIKFTEKGYIKLKVSKKYQNQQHSKLDLIFSVEDTGVGIPDDQKEKIF